LFIKELKMSSIIAFCGLDCSQCEAYIVTQADDEEGKIKLAEKWSIEYDSPEIDVVSAPVMAAMQVNAWVVTVCYAGSENVRLKRATRPVRSARIMPVRGWKISWKRLPMRVRTWKPCVDRLILL